VKKLDIGPYSETYHFSSERSALKSVLTSLDLLLYLQNYPTRWILPQNIRIISV